MGTDVGPGHCNELFLFVVFLLINHTQLFYYSTLLSFPRHYPSLTLSGSGKALQFCDWFKPITYLIQFRLATDSKTSDNNFELYRKHGVSFLEDFILEGYTSEIFSVL